MVRHTTSILVAPVRGAAITGLVHLALLLHATGLAALARTTLSVLGQVVVQQLGVCLLVRQDVEEGGRCIATRDPSSVKPCASQSRRQAEGRWGPCVERLLIKRLGLIVNTSTDVWDTRVA